MRVAFVLAVVLAVALVATTGEAQRQGARTGVSRTECQSVTTTATKMQPFTDARFRAWGCLTPIGGTTGVYVVDPADTDTTEGRGPFCAGSSCHGAVFSNETSEVYLMAASGTVSVCCEYEME